MNIIFAEDKSTKCCVCTDAYNTYMICKSNSQFLLRVHCSNTGYFLPYTATRQYNKFAKLCNFVINRNDLIFFAELFFK